MEKWVEELNELAGHIDEWSDEKVHQTAYRIFNAHPRYDSGDPGGSTHVLWSKGTRADLGVVVKKFKPMIDRMELKYPDYNERMRMKRRNPNGPSSD